MEQYHILLLRILKVNRMKLKENDIVVLTVDIQKKNLKAGDIGTIVYSHKGGTAYEVEFATFAGETISVETLYASQIRPVSENEIPHVRSVKVA